jgi:RHS repeat-associated protein
LTNADYTSGESYEYAYDPVGNRLQQIINGDTTDYLYDAANRLEAVNGQSYSFDNNGNLLATGVMTNVFDTANRLIETNRNGTALQPVYNGVGDRVAQMVGVTTTYFALDVIGLPEVIQTSEGNSYLHLPGMIVAESAEGEVRYLLGDGLGSVRQAVDDTGQVVVYNEYDPYGNPITDHGSRITPYGYTGEWWQNDVGLLHLRARWYRPETGTFLSVDPVESEPPYLYVGGNPINRIDPSGRQGPPGWCPPGVVYCPNPWQPGDWDEFWESVEDIVTSMDDVAMAVYKSIGPVKYQEIIDAVIWSHSNSREDDGITFGGALFINTILAQQATATWPEYFVELEANGECAPPSGYTSGIEIAYDFKHQEGGIFAYHGPMLSFGTAVGFGGEGYLGKLRGFATQDYDVGVGAYSGYFAAGDVNASLPVVGLASLGLVGIEAVPLSKPDLEKGIPYKKINREGVFATYYGLTGSIGVASPINGDIAVTNYSLLLRKRYVESVPYAMYVLDLLSLSRPPDMNESQIIELKQNIAFRKLTAAQMTVEILAVEAAATLVFAPFASLIPESIGELWSFVDRP